MYNNATQYGIQLNANSTIMPFVLSAIRKELETRVEKQKKKKERKREID